MFKIRGYYAQIKDYVQDNPRRLCVQNLGYPETDFVISQIITIGLRNAVWYAVQKHK